MAPLPMLMAIMTLLLQLRASDPQCTYTPYEWQQFCLINSSTSTVNPAPFTLCRAPWCTLLQAEPDGLVLESHREWLLAARQFVCGALNRQRRQWGTPDAVNSSLAFLGDSLETACGNISQWRPSARLSDAVTLLYQFNHRTDLLCPVNSGAAVDTFYYTRAPDILVLRQQREPKNSTTHTVSALGSAYSVNLTLLVLLILFIFAATLMMLKMVADRSANRHWLWCLNQGTVDGAYGDVQQEMERISHIEEHVLSSEEEEEESK